MSLSTETGMILHNADVIRTNASKIREAFPFDVAKLRLSGPDGINTNLYGLFRTDTWEQVADSSVSAKYCPHTCEDVAVLTEAAMAIVGADAVLNCHWNNGHYVTVQPSKAKRLSIFGTEDNIFPVFGLSAGYNGKSYSAGLWQKRDMCKNMSIMRTVRGCQTNIRHTKNLRNKMAELVDSFGLLSEKWENVGQTALQLESESVSLRAFFDHVFPMAESKAAETRSAERMEKIIRRIQRETIVSGRPNLSIGNDIVVSKWLALQGLQGFLQHETLASKRQKTEFGKALQTMEGVTATLLDKAERYLVG